MSREVLDDWDWDKEEDSLRTDDYIEDEVGSEDVVMLKNFTSEDEAHICAAALTSEGIDARVIASNMRQITPFAYGNVRLYVAKSQVPEARDILERIEEENRAQQKPIDTGASKILTSIVIGIMVLMVALVLYFFYIST